MISCRTANEDVSFIKDYKYSLKYGLLAPPNNKSWSIILNNSECKFGKLSNKKQII